MKLRRIAAMIVCLAVCVPCRAADAPQTAAAAWIVYDAGSGRVLCAQNETQRRSIASTTKIMTALVALEHGAADERVTVRREHLVEGSSMYLREGEELTLEELVYGLLLASGNDAAECIAAHCGGSVAAFVALMNEKAAALGLTNTHFENPSGLDAQGHYSCALDMARLAAYALEQPTFLRIVSTATATVGSRTLSNHNKLLTRRSDCIGLKTGYTGDAGRTLVTACERDGLRLVCVTLRDGNDWNDHEALYDWAFGEFAPVCALRAGEVCGTVAVHGGALGAVDAVAAEAMVCALRADEAISLRIELADAVDAPVREGDALGWAVICCDDEELGRVALTAASDIDAAQQQEQPGFWARLAALFGFEDG